MNAPRAMKQPVRAPGEIQASVLAQVRFTTPAVTEEATAAPNEDAAVEAAPTRFNVSDARRTFTINDDDIEYFVAVMDEEGEHVWQIALWPNPPASQLPDVELSHCLVVGSKNQAREILRSLTGAPAFVPPKSQANGGNARQTGYAGGVAQRPGRTQQKQG